MKKNIWLILTLIILAVSAYYLTSKSTRSTIKTENSDFAVEDTARITKIFMSDKSNQNVLLTRSDKGWIVNNKYRARQDAVDVLLTTIRKLKVRTPISRASFKNIVKKIASTSVKVEIYKGKGTPSKVYYVGGPDQLHEGTHMLMENSTVPFLMHIEGFRGYLTPRYFTSEDDWRFTGIFNYQPQNIASIKVEYFQSPNRSFEILTNQGDFKIIKLNSGFESSVVDTNKLFNYLNLFKKIHFEGFEQTKDENYINTIKAGDPYVTYTVTDISGISKQIKTFRKPIENGSDYEGNKIEYDLDRLYGYIDNREFVVIQYIIFDPLNRDFEYFLP